jgi:3-phosphoshikimate 1-carboxyvinyltransferase
MQRALAAALVSVGTHTINNPGQSNDDKAAIEIIRRLGAKINDTNGTLIIQSRGVETWNESLDCGESGLGIRMFTPIAGLSEKEVTITGSGSLMERPMDFFDEILPLLGVSVKSNNGKLPLIIKGPLMPRNITVDGSLSSQFLTGLLMAYAAAGASDVSIEVKNLRSRPYIDLTLKVMSDFGLKIPANKDYEVFYFDKNPSGEPRNTNYTVEGDWSGAAFLLVAGAISGSANIRGLDLTSTQADRAIFDVLVLANASIAVEAKGIKVHEGPMNPFTFDATDCPDLFPPLVSLAAYCNGQSTITGVTRLFHKESNRAASLQEEFGKMGIKIDIIEDEMFIYGGGGVRGAQVHSHHDHRIAMACAVAALKADGATTIEGAEAVKKSYPGFWDDLETLGADVSLNYKLNTHE